MAFLQFKMNSEGFSFNFLINNYIEKFLVNNIKAYKIYANIIKPKSFFEGVISRPSFSITDTGAMFLLVPCVRSRRWKLVVKY